VQQVTGVPTPVQFAGKPLVLGHGLTTLPHAMHAVCRQLLVSVFSVKVKVVLTPVGNCRGRPSTVSQGVVRHEPAVPPQSASVLQEPNLFAAALVVQSLGPATLTPL
jgi:hypothetical protein